MRNAVVADGRRQVNNLIRADSRAVRAPELTSVRAVIRGEVRDVPSCGEVAGEGTIHAWGKIHMERALSRAVADPKVFSASHIGAARHKEV